MKYFKISFAFLVLINFITVQSMSAHPLQGHIVSIQDVQKQLDSQSSQRIGNIQEIQKLLRHSEVRKHLGELCDLQKIEVAVANLDAETLEDLAVRSRLANDQLQAGVSKGGWGLITIAIIVAIIFIVIAANELYH